MKSKPFIFAIEDNVDIVEVLEFHVKREGFDFAHSLDGKEGLERVLTSKPTLLLLDLMLPNMSGLDICRELRSRSETQNLPIIILTATGRESDIIGGLDLGADDYVTKPFSAKELIARIKAVLRRVPNREKDDRIFRFKDLMIDLDKHEVRLGSDLLPLTRSEFRLLQAMTSSPGRVCTREVMISKMTDGDVTIIDRNVDVHVASLRKKLGEYGQKIVTIRGVGYRFDAE